MIFGPSGGAGGISAWTTGFVYAVGDVVYYAKSTYLCITAHTSAAAFETDFSAIKWQLLSQLLPNYISDYDGSNIGKWATYADAAGTSPVDGTGGSPTVTYAVSTDSSLRGTTNFLFTHGASNQQGQGFSYDFSIDPSDKGKVLQCSLEYLIASGTYASGDLTFWIYDVTNSALIQPAPYSIQNSGIIEKFAFEFQTSSSSTSYRLIAHVTTTTATAYTIRFRNWNCGPQAKLYGSPIVDTISFTPTGSWVSNATYTGRYYKEGQRAKGTIRVSTSGAPTAASLTVTLPFTIDTTALISTTEDVVLGRGIVRDSATATYSDVLVRYNSTTSVALDCGGITTHAGNVYSKEISNVNATNPITFGASDYVEFNFDIPVLGWSSSQVMSSDAATTVVAARVYKSGTQAITAGDTKITSWTVDIDRNGMWDAANNRFNILTPGDYDLILQVQATTAGASQLPAYKVNGGSAVYVGSLTNSTSDRSGGSATLMNLKAGDYVEVYHSVSANCTVQAGNSNTFATLKRISGPAQIAASETVSALYTGAPPTGTLNSSYNTTTFGTKAKDTHGAYSSGSYTIPSAGTYSIAAATEQAATYAAGNLAITAIFVDGVQVMTNAQVGFTTAGQLYPIVVVHSYPLLAGQVVTIRSKNTGTTPSFNASAATNYFSITRTGNY